MIDWEAHWSRYKVDFGSESSALKQSVLDAFPTFTQKFEGKVPHMYLDDADPPGPYVTTGIGNLIDPISTALGLPWRHKADNSLASQAEITAAWNAVKARKDLAPKGGGSFANVTDLILQDKDITALVQKKMMANASILSQRYPNLAQWPADAQMGLMSMSWAMGPAFNFPAFKAATDSLDFGDAKLQSKYKGVGSAPRIAANDVLFDNAAYVMANHLDPNKVYYPQELSTGFFLAEVKAMPDWMKIAIPLGIFGGAAVLLLSSKGVGKFSKQLDTEVMG
jgi:hypothetical protein